MRVIFMGTPDFAVVSLNYLIKKEVNIVGVVTVPDKPQGRGRTVQASPVKIAAQKAGIPVLQPENLKDKKFIKQLKSLDADLFLVVAFKILPENIFTIPAQGTVNLHGSILPKYRGAAPINWAIINGEQETGVTTFFIKEQVDTGNIINTRRVQITPEMTAGELHDVMAVVGSKLLFETVQMIQSGTVNTTKQDDTLATKAPKIFREDCLIDFNQPVQTVHNFIRGLAPYPAAHSFIKNKMIKILRAYIMDYNSQIHDPGRIIGFGEKNDRILIQTGPGIIAVFEVQLEGKKKMPVEEFLKGFDLSSASYFTSG